MKNQLIRGFFLGFIKIHILHHASKEPIYGKEFSAELQRHGYDISFGTLYPIFHKLEQNGLLTRQKKTVGGKIRKYYSATESGKEMLEEAKRKSRELVDELFED
ncbi:MAG: helix-turn-helix transcriptional regulator [Candidatus Marinimicrobia bacterium]|nr:helix-turn-helix transcriptional regulator [Candidatus Neomarinimicrobiota bacterium]